ncbi:hypothetical protein [Limnohabitans sp.]|uniref:hypothetical protein n=1 Tax=Limnohabitans sp. TaxID=1907725 RepID=UPI00286F8A8C|nr:hypothetical protein [Limnohabitans sp.]
MDFSAIDGSWVDICSIISGFVYIYYRRRCENLNPNAKRYKLISKKTSLDFGSGVAIFPLLIMVGSAVSSALLDSLVESSSITLAVAGFCGAIAILEEDA